MLDPERIRPLEYNVVIELMPTDEKVGNIWKPESVIDKDQRATTVGRVVSMAERAFSDPDMFGDLRPAVGDVVVVGKYTGQPLTRSASDANTTFRMMKDKDVLGIVSND